MEEKAHQRPKVREHEGVRLVGQREDGVEVGHRQELRLPGEQPLRLGQRLALGAVAVSAGVVGGALKAASRTPLQVPAERCRAAELDVAHHADVGSWQQRMGQAVAFSVEPKHIGKLHGRSLAGLLLLCRG